MTFEVGKSHPLAR